MNRPGGFAADFL